MSEKLSGLLILPGHAIYRDGVWHGIERGGRKAARVLEKHVACACRIYRKRSYKALCVSGGCSRPDIEAVRNVSEAAGLTAFIQENTEELNAFGIELIEESWARDSFENMFFSLLAYHQRYETWPERVGVVSWKYKALRFYAAAIGLGIAECFVFYGCGDVVGTEAVTDVTRREAENLARIVQEVEGKREVRDPLHRGKWFQDKRRKRMPSNITDNDVYLNDVKNVYRQGAHLIDSVERSKIGGWSGIKWPWSGKGN